MSGRVWANGTGSGVDFRLGHLNRKWGNGNRLPTPSAKRRFAAWLTNEVLSGTGVP